MLLIRYRLGRRPEVRSRAVGPFSRSAGGVLSNELIYRPRALEHHARRSEEEREPLALPTAWVRWTWPVVLLTSAVLGALGLALLGGG